MPEALSSCGADPVRNHELAELAPGVLAPANQKKLVIGKFLILRLATASALVRYLIDLASETGSGCRSGPASSGARLNLPAAFQIAPLEAPTLAPALRLIAPTLLWRWPFPASRPEEAVWKKWTANQELRR